MVLDRLYRIRLPFQATSLSFCWLLSFACFLAYMVTPASETFFNDIKVIYDLYFILLISYHTLMFTSSLFYDYQYYVVYRVYYVYPITKKKRKAFLFPCVCSYCNLFNLPSWAFMAFWILRFASGASSLS